jgi:transcriptional regulator with XRE-family HTH domain
MFERLMIDMALAQRLGALRKERGLTQQELADTASVHMMQVHRYETGASQPSVEVLKKLATALRVTTDELLFGKDERGPDEELRLQFEAICRLDPHEKQVVIEVLDSLLLRHDARRWTAREKAS